MGSFSGPAWKNKVLTEKSLRKTAYHEAGHTIVAYFTDGAASVHKVTIQPRGHALGVVNSSLVLKLTFLLVRSGYHLL